MNYLKQIFMLISVIVVLILPASIMAKTINLNYSIFFPGTHGQCIDGVNWAKEIEKRTNGRIKITVFPGGTLTKANQCFDGVKNGISDLGMSCFAYTRGRFPVMEAVDLPLGYPDGIVATRVANAFYKKFWPEKPDELKDVKVLYLHAHGPGLLHTTKPVRTLEDFRNLKIRSTGLSSKVVGALNGVSVAMSQGGTYEALQKGVVEGSFGPIEVLKGWRQAEVVKYSTNCYNIGYTTSMFVVMNLKRWNDLPADIQKIFDEVSNEWIDVHGKTWNSGDEKGREYTKSRGNKIIELTPQEAARWKEKVSPVIDDYINSAKRKGLPGKKYVDALYELIAQYSK